jgi:hypothetical protein
MKIKNLVFIVSAVLMVACASSPQKNAVPNIQTAGPGVGLDDKPVGGGSEYLLICKAKKSHFQFDWSAASVGSDQLDQNSVRYKFQAATKPAGEKGENLKVGECGWAGRALAANKKESSEFFMKSLSDESTQAFYKMRTGRVFKLPVRRGKAGMVVLPKSEVRVVL